MASSASRVLALLELLQARPGLTGPELAQRLDVDERTVRRHLRTLDDVGVPVVARRGRHGGYRLLPGYRLPPLMLSGDEAVAVVLGLLAAERTGLHAAAPAVATARAKLERVLPDAVRDQVRAVADVLGFTAPARTATPPDADVLLALGAAARDGNRVRLAYRSFGGDTSERELDPWGITFHAGRWYVSGHDHARDDVRNFRVDRIARVDVLGAGSTPPAGFDAAEQVVAGIAAVGWAHAIEVVLHVPVDEARRLLPRSVGTLARHSSGTLFTGRAEHLDGAARMLAGLGVDFTVVAPAELRSEVRALAERLLRRSL
ncbi:MAG: YafY family transcriptional regulator [Pseudonocardia sp.]|uniref:helix-turn-helix transcriptional regulator n=1 Tax=unclassified Pseudonocardia TaxID=2619320 RepID=UPI0008692698|nr:MULTISPECIES: YafY family protein [unclassified Pseudonocardia]MBN9109663.1 YafY family transcriptional regulator [Pseudonocardia sp.]ODU13791.1 MAG: transcriptional regulator [Pseudonocardia sp. SCN 72-51]ODV09091.1 MAG: transcriptional regulator [Pseudonocardia sp. SCN 73-27]